MNLRHNFLSKPLLSGSLKPGHAARGMAREAVVTSATLSRQDLRRIVAEMVD